MNGRNCKFTFIVKLMMKSASYGNACDKIRFKDRVNNVKRCIMHYVCNNEWVCRIGYFHYFLYFYVKEL